MEQLRLNWPNMGMDQWGKGQQFAYLIKYLMRHIQVFNHEKNIKILKN